MVIRVVVAEVVAATLALAGVAPRKVRRMVAVKKTLVVATTAGVHAPPTQASHGKIPVMAAVTVLLNRAASVALTVTNSHARREKNNNARIHAAPVSTWETSAMTLTSASPPAMYQLAFHPQACQHAALVVAEAAIVAAVAVETSAEVVHAQAVAVGATRAAAFGADLHINHRWIEQGTPQHGPRATRLALIAGSQAALKDIDGHYGRRPHRRTGSQTVHARDHHLPGV